ncbi:MAG: SAM-dependent methyltransferase [Pseudomonadota bacterium]
MAPDPRLLHHLRERGPLTVAELFRWAVGEGGSYQRAPDLVFGAAGDFVTAPEISQTFGELIGLGLADAWQRLGGGAAVLAELGPGRGTLLADLWRGVAVVPGAHDAWQVHLVERSRSLRERQAEVLAAARPVWHDTVDALPEDRPLLLVANEFLDALAIHQLERTAEGWAERRVGLDARGEIAFRCAPAPPALAEAAAARFADAALGAVAELAPERDAVVAELARRIAGNGGLAYLIDYGGLALTPVDTLQAAHRHAAVDVLAHAGAADLSSAVDFAPLRAVAAATGAAVFGPIPQARFLRALGIELRSVQLSGRLRGAERQAVFSGVRRLLAPEAMGEAFKVLAVAHPALGVPAGFLAEDAV